MVRPAAATIPNGLPWKPYTYRGNGTDTLTAWMDGEPDSPLPPDVRRPGQWRKVLPCGTAAAVRRHTRHREPLDFECLVFRARQAAGQRARKRASAAAARLAEATAEYYGKTA